ncbi:MAG: VanZ family protein [Janthinobacterium lividum]
MRRPVLLGGSEGLRTSSVVAWWVFTWVPVVVCVLVLSGESTDTFSSAHTAGWLRHLAEALLGPIHQISWDNANFAVRKTGHFIGYGLVGLSWFRAWLLTWQPMFSRRTASTWRAYAASMAIFCTLVCATADEVHQTYIPSRTGLVTDACLDTVGAVTMMLLVSSLWLRGRSKPPAAN